MIFVIRDGELRIRIIKDNVCHKAKSTAKNFSRILSFSIRPEDLISVLSGQPPGLPAFEGAEVQTLKEDGRTCLSLYGRGEKIMRKIWFSDDYNQVRQMEYYDKSGNLDYTIQFDEFRPLGHSVYPSRVKIGGARGINISVSIEKFQVGIPIFADTFELKGCDAK